MDAELLNRCSEPGSIGSDRLRVWEGMVFGFTLDKDPQLLLNLKLSRMRHPSAGRWLGLTSCPAAARLSWASESMNKSSNTAVTMELRNIVEMVMSGTSNRNR